MRKKIDRFIKKEQNIKDFINKNKHNTFMTNINMK